MVRRASSVQSLLNRLSQLVEDATSQYARLVLIVGQHGTGKSAVLREFAHRGGHPVIDLGADLPQGIFEVPARRRPVAASDRVGEQLRANDDVAFVDNIEILFQPGLNLDPLKLLQDNARNRVIVATWPGTFDGRDLTFAEPGHPEFRLYPAAEVRILTL